MCNAKTVSLFKHFNLSKHVFLRFSARFNSLYDVIMLPGTIKTVVFYLRSMFPVPRFSRGIGLVLRRRCEKNLAVEGLRSFGQFFAIPFRYFGLVFEVTTSVKVQDKCV